MSVKTKFCIDRRNWRFFRKVRSNIDSFSFIQFAYTKSSAQITEISLQNNWSTKIKQQKTCKKSRLTADLQDTIPFQSKIPS